MVYFEMTIINGNVSQAFDISVNKNLYEYLTTHENIHTHDENWFEILLNQSDVDMIKKLCETPKEKELIASNIKYNTIIDILIHRVVLISQ